MTRTVLASQSAVRAALLTAAGVAFDQVGSGVDETVIKDALLEQGATPRQVAAALAEAKALAVSVLERGLVIGADQTLDVDGVLFDKADSLNEARVRLAALRGRSHQLHAGVAIAQGGEIVWRRSETATLTMRAFSDAFLDDYLARHGPAALSSVGCYQLEGAGLQLFDRIEGDYFTILGLPMLDLLAFLRERGALAA